MGGADRAPDTVDAIGKRRWGTAMKRFECIRPLLETEHPPRSVVQARAAECGRSTSTLYRYLKAFYAGTGTVSDLAPAKRVGKPLLGSRQEAILGEVINEFFLHRQKP